MKRKMKDVNKNFHIMTSNKKLNSVWEYKSKFMGFNKVLDILDKDHKKSNDQSNLPPFFEPIITFDADSEIIDELNQLGLRYLAK